MLLTFLVLANGVPAAGLTFVALALVAQRLQKRARVLLYAALALLTTAFLLHLRGDTALDLVGASGYGWAYQLKSVVKHGAEAGGWMLVAIALAASCRHVRLRSAR
jgi:putative exporter of polyketide antibiotics